MSGAEKRYYGADIPRSTGPHPDPLADRNWAEDAPHENGNYECRCCECDQTFIGHKRRVLCKLCSNLLTPSVTSTHRGSEP